MTRARAAAGLVAWLLFVGGCASMLVALGHGPLAGPPQWTGPAVRNWAVDEGPVVATIALVRIAALVACLFLASTTFLGTVARLVHAAGAVRLLDRATLAFLRPVLTAAVGTTFAATSLIGPWSGPAFAAAAGNPPPGPAAAAPTMHLLPARPAPPVMHRLDPAPADDAEQPGPPTEPAPTPPPLAAATPTDPPVERTVTLRPGDHLWGVARTTLTRAWNRHPTDHDVARYWTELVDHNRSRLADPTNPDLVYPGQVIALPRPPADGAGP